MNCLGPVRRRDHSSSSWMVRGRTEVVHALGVTSTKLARHKPDPSTSLLSSRRYAVSSLPHVPLVAASSSCVVGVVVPSLRCVSERWVEKVRWRCLPWYFKRKNDNERRIWVVVRRLAATSLSATWHLDYSLAVACVDSGVLT